LNFEVDNGSGSNNDMSVSTEGWTWGFVQSEQKPAYPLCLLTLWHCFVSVTAVVAVCVN